MFSYMNQDTLSDPRNPASKELAKMRAELAEEMSELAEIEEHVGANAAHLGYLHSEYSANRNRVEHYYEPRLGPLRALTHAISEKCKLVELQLGWYERKIVEQDRRGGAFLEVRDMRDAANELMKQVRSNLLRAYEEIDNCPEDTLKMISNYDSPPDVALETMRMVMRLRGEEDCSWKASQVLVSHTYFTGFFTARSESLLKMKDMLEDELMEELEHYCYDVTHAVPALYQSSTPIGCLGQWLHALRDYYRVKMITAPVLLKNTTYEYTQSVIALAQRITFEYKKKKSATTVAAATTAAVANEEDAAQQKVPMAENDLTPGDAAVLKEYAQIKSRLNQHSTTSLETQELLVKLRHRLNQLKAEAQVAEEEMLAVDKDMKTEMEAMRGDYDGTMLPVQYQIEDKTSELLDRLASVARTTK